MESEDATGTGAIGKGRGLLGDLITETQGCGRPCRRGGDSSGRRYMLKDQTEALGSVIKMAIHFLTLSS